MCSSYVVTTRRRCLLESAGMCGRCGRWGVGEVGCVACMCWALCMGVVFRYVGVVFTCCCVL